MKKSDLDEIKKAILPSMADLFETHAEHIKKLFETHSRETKVLIEQTNKRIEIAIEFAQKAMENSSVTKDHSKRIKKLEGDVDVIKKVIKSV